MTNTTMRTVSCLLGLTLLTTACTSSAVDVQAWCAEVQDATRQFLDAEAGKAELPDPAEMLKLFEDGPEAVRNAYNGLEDHEGIDALAAGKLVHEPMLDTCEDHWSAWMLEADEDPSTATTPTPRGAGVRADDVLSADALPTQAVISLFAFLPPLEPTDLCELVGLDKATVALFTDVPSEQLVPDAAAEGSRLACVWSVGEREASSGTAPPDLLEVGAARLGPDTRMHSMVDPDTLVTTPAGWIVSEEPTVTPSGRALMTYVDLWSNAGGAHVWAGASDRLENPSATAGALLDHVLEHLSDEKP